MQAFKRYKLAFLSIIIAVLLVISAVVIVQNLPTQKPQPSTTPTPSPAPTSTQNPPTPTRTTTTPPLTPIITEPPQPTPIPSILPGEVTQYQGVNLTPINGYINYLIQHPDVAIAGTQYIDPATYKLAVTGMVNNPTSYTYDQIVNGFNSSLQVATLPCVEGWSVTLLWQGVPLMDILNRTGASPDANTLIFLASDGYSSSLPINYVKQNNIMIAYKMNNLTFTPQTGWPFFLVAKNQYGYKWVEWITEINVSSDSSYLGYWESRGYPNDATVTGPSQTQPLISPQNLLPITAISIACVTAAVGVLVWWKKRNPKKVEVKNLP
jgi:DMSO/TMAO reductase YedYZ molybdopterin-dependent catalytic subunit